MLCNPVFYIFAKAIMFSFSISFNWVSEIPEWIFKTPFFYVSSFSVAMGAIFSLPMLSIAHTSTHL